MVLVGCIAHINGGLDVSRIGKKDKGVTLRKGGEEKKMEKVLRSQVYGDT